jgi:hypothetical protein
MTVIAPTLTKSVPAGLPNEQLVPGLLITLSKNLESGDRSFSRFIWEVVAANKGHVVIEPARKSAPPKYLGSGPHLICTDEYEFYDADHLLKALEPERQGQAA